jgi:addiction module HigA family antidote
MKQDRLPPVHPGEILFEEFLKPLAISQYRLAKDIHVTPIRISQIIRGKRSITADTALRLGKYFNMTPQFWLNMQDRYDLETAQDQLDNELSSIPVFKQAS